MENVLYALSSVCEAAVVGVDDEILGQAVHAFVVLDPGARVTERDIMQHCHEHLESHMVPKVVHIVSALQKTDTGKIRKTGLAEAARAKMRDMASNVAMINQSFKEERERMR